jgi:hypothetical protein
MRPTLFSALFCLLLVSQTSLCIAQPVNWRLPSPTNSSQPNLSASPNGDLVLSWIERLPNKHYQLRYSIQNKNQIWSRPKTITSSERMFVNWADFSAVRILNDGSIWAHTLERSGKGTYDYDVILHRSVDKGANWKKTRVHQTQGGEHGFASLWPWSSSQLALVWLDGSASYSAEHAAHHGHGGMMTLRGAVFDNSLKKISDIEIDGSVCDCCQTDVALSSKGPIVVYRNRTEKELRDIYVSRYQNGAWQAAKRVHADNWTMPACPVNGPAIAANNNQVWVAWFTSPDKPTVKLAVSNNAGDEFTKTVIVDDQYVDGRVDVLHHAHSIWVSWLTEKERVQTLNVAEYSPDLKTLRQHLRLPTIQGNGRGTGFPRMQAQGDHLFMVATEVINGQPQLKGYTIPHKVQP